MILTEAAFLGVLGGLSGQTSQYLAYGMAFAVGASVLSGLYPAWKAANESPVKALRG